MANDTKFEWDENKNKSNFQKHGITFQEAVDIFNYPMLSDFDYDHLYESREVSIGLMKRIVVIMLVHVDRADKIRIISARKATKKEAKKYHDHFKGKA